MSSKYSKALGIASDVEVTTPLSISGATTWLVSKVPAVLGGSLAEKAYDWAVSRWPKHPRGADFVGSLGVIIAAYGMQALMTRFNGGNTHMVDKVTDGMMGRVSPALWRLLKSLWPSGGGGPKAPAPRGGAAEDYKNLPGPANASLDGDRKAVIDVAGLLRDSPETTKLLADELFAVMKREGHDVDEAGHQAMVKSFREATAKMAQGNF